MSLSPIASRLAPSPARLPSATAVAAGGPASPLPAVTAPQAQGIIGDAFGFMKDVVVGFVQGAWDMIKGFGHMLFHPIQTLKGIGAFFGGLFKDPVGTVKQAASAIAAPYVEALRTGHPGAAIGRGFFDALMIFVGPAKIIEDTKNFLVRTADQVGYAVNGSIRGAANFTGGMMNGASRMSYTSSGLMNPSYAYRGMGGMSAAPQAMGGMAGGPMGIGSMPPAMVMPASMPMMGGGMGAGMAMMPQAMEAGAMAVPMAGEAAPMVSNDLVQLARMGQPQALATVGQAAQLGDPAALQTLQDAARAGQAQALLALRDVAANGADPQIAQLVNMARAGDPQAIKALVQAAETGHPQATAAMWDPVIARNASGQPISGTLAALTPEEQGQIAQALSRLSRPQLEAALQDPAMLASTPLDANMVRQILNSPEGYQLIQDAANRAAQQQLGLSSMNAAPAAAAAPQAGAAAQSAVPDVARTASWSTQPANLLSQRLSAAATQITGRSVTMVKFGLQREGEAINAYGKILDQAGQKLASGDMAGARQLVEQANQNSGVQAALQVAQRFYNQPITAI